MSEVASGPATVVAALTAAAATLAAAGIEDGRREARLLMAHLLGIDQAAVFARPERPLTMDQVVAFDVLVARRARREPLSRIAGTREFWSLPFRLTADTLDPRPDSETLIQAALDALPDRSAALSVLDLGTGSGCLLLALLSELPNATGLGVDLSPGAVAGAAANARLLGLAGRARFAVSDWGQSVTGRFDVILVNPPYIAIKDIPGLEPEVREWDPKLALGAGADGLDAVRILAPQLVQLIDNTGFIIVELGAGQDAAAAAIFEAAGLAVTGRPRDLGGVVRCLLMRPAGSR